MNTYRLRVGIAKLGRRRKRVRVFESSQRSRMDLGSVVISCLARVSFGLAPLHIVHFALRPGRQVIEFGPTVLEEPRERRRHVKVGGNGGAERRGQGPAGTLRFTPAEQLQS